MSSRIFGTASVTAAVFFLVLACSLAFAQEAKQERALTFTFEDPEIEWGACPEFFPEGCEIAVLHGDPAEENADIFFKVPGGTKLPAHWHTSAERMVLVSGELQVTYEGQETEVLKPGTYAYGPPKLKHDGFCAEGDPCILFIAFEEPVDAFPVKKTTDSN